MLSTAEQIIRGIERDRAARGRQIAEHLAAGRLVEETRPNGIAARWCVHAGGDPWPLAKDLERREFTQRHRLELVD